MTNQATQTGAPQTIKQMQLGNQAVIIKINGTFQQIQRIQMLGLRKGGHIKVVHGPGRRGAVVQSGGARIALGKEIIEQIEVTPINVQEDQTR
ncbi:FeoA family protein [Celerinatantimonas diazotrophica]|uniref:Ferrous iron transport protein A n=1 Tax=Celerinatantimonas diazotrophica TaxID=412034 RepID=A0A4R1KJX2_9GAMM|nr:FeoA family protein [Celerinatantimonas diazotrophica]TCK63909.1 ferrous iron transport protein A [Celerinatantimonas diazotrophica]CAG9296994.1 hypothetical protein CEDIAZO_02156 [Celerinatantimonas diazotrophica]